MVLTTGVPRAVVVARQRCPGVSQSESSVVVVALESIGRAPPRSRPAAFQELSAAGVTIAIATGRSTRALYDHVARLDLKRELPIVCFNGAVGVRCAPPRERAPQQHEQLFSVPLPRAATDAVLAFAAARGLLVQYYVRFDETMPSNSELKLDPQPDRTLPPATWPATYRPSCELRCMIEYRRSASPLSTVGGFRRHVREACTSSHRGRWPYRGVFSSSSSARTARGRSSPRTRTTPCEVRDTIYVAFADDSHREFARRYAALTGASHTALDGDYAEALARAPPSKLLVMCDDVDAVKAELVAALPRGAAHCVRGSPPFFVEVTRRVGGGTVAGGARVVSATPSGVYYNRRSFSLSSSRRPNRLLSHSATPPLVTAAGPSAPRGGAVACGRVVVWSSCRRCCGGEVLHPDVNKGAGLARLCAALDVPPARVVAFGDGDNDLEFLATAGLGLAMANARENVKAAADGVTARSNDDDGVAFELARLQREGLLPAATTTTAGMAL